MQVFSRDKLEIEEIPICKQSVWV